mgnify:CR=1 FL=1
MPVPSASEVPTRTGFFEVRFESIGGLGAHAAVHGLRESWKRRQLSDNFPALVCHHATRVPTDLVELADRVHDMLNERIDRITSEFEQRSSTIVDGISERTEQVHDSLKNSSDSLLLEP